MKFLNSVWKAPALRLLPRAPRGGLAGGEGECWNPRGGRPPDWSRALPEVEGQGRDQVFLPSWSEIWTALGARNPGAVLSRRGRRPVRCSTARCKMPCHWESLRPEH